MQALHHAMFHIEQQVSITHKHSVNAVYMLRMRVRMHRGPEVLACISFVLRRLHQYLASEATFDPPVALYVAAVFRWSRNCASPSGEL